jgi:hypothetical protein
VTKLTKAKLAKLTREEKLAIIEAIEEKKRRAKAAKPGYKPHEGQLKMHLDPSRERWVLCGNGWGKSAALTQEVHAAATGYNPWTKETTKVPARIIVLLDSPEKIKDQFFFEYRKWFPVNEDNFYKDGKPYARRYVYDNGSEITFMFFDQDENKFEGISDIDYIFSDEPMPRSIYVGLYRSLRGVDSNPRLLMCGTAISQAWIRRDIWLPWSRGELKDTQCFQFSSEQNKQNLREGFLESFSSRLTVAERKVRLEGGFFSSEGLALAEFLDSKKHLIEPFEVPHEWPCIIIADFHPRKAHVFLLITADKDDNVYVVDEWASRKTPQDLAIQLHDRWSKHRIVDIVCDSLGSSELTGGMGNLSFIQALNRVWQEEELGWRVRPTTWAEKQDEAWMQLIQSHLVIPREPNNFGEYLPKLRIFNHCKALWHDLENVSWQRYKGMEENKPKLDMVMMDYLSCLKYGLAARPRYSYSKERVIKSRTSPWSGAASNRGEKALETDSDSWDD